VKVLPPVDLNTLQEYARDYERLSQSYAKRLVDDEFPVQTWARQQWVAIQAIHTAFYEQGYGRSLDALGETALAAIIEKQRRFFAQWTDDLLSLDRLPSYEAITARTKLYALSSSASYQRGYTDRLRIPPLPSYPKDGTTACIVGCACEWEFEQLAGFGNWNLTWIVRPVEHCPHCTLRGMEWNPLRIREGIILPYNPLGLFRLTAA
jgi:hypothetical protein